MKWRNFRMNCLRVFSRQASPMTIFWMSECRFPLNVKRRKIYRDSISHVRAQTSHFAHFRHFCWISWCSSIVTTHKVRVLQLLLKLGSCWANILPIIAEHFFIVSTWERHHYFKWRGTINHSQYRMMPLWASARPYRPLDLQGWSTTFRVHSIVCRERIMFT